MSNYSYPDLRPVMFNEERKINRLLGNDKDGVLYIGKANSFVGRVADLKKSISSNSHECGARYKSNKNISSKFTFENLYITLVGSNDPRKIESDLLKSYEIKFGELPPLNRVS